MSVPTAISGGRRVRIKSATQPSKSVAFNAENVLKISIWTTKFYVVTDEPECGIGHPACDLTRRCTQPTAKISSVHFPNAYYRKATCSWHIAAKVGSFIELTFLAFDINSRHQCTHSSTSLTLFDGSSDKSDVLGIYCNATAPPKILRSSFNNMFLKFVSGTDDPGRGFLTEYQARTFELNSTFGNSSGKKRKGKALARKYSVILLAVCTLHLLLMSFRKFLFRFFFHVSYLLFVLVSNKHCETRNNDLFIEANGFLVTGKVDL